MPDADPHVIGTVSFRACIVTLATPSRLDWTLVIFIASFPYILWIMALHTQLCFHAYLSSFFNREGNIPGATCGIAVDVVVIQLAGITSGLKSKAYPTFFISSWRIVGDHSLEVVPSMLHMVGFSNLTSTATTTACSRVASSSNKVEMFLSFNS